MSDAMVKTTDIYGNEYHVPVSTLSWRPAAYAIIVRNNEILLVKERDSFHMPGGGVDFGETPEEAVIREVREETGLVIANPALAGSLSTFFAHAHKASTQVVSHVQSLLLYYTCELAGGNVSVDGLEDDEKQSGLTPEWVDLADLDALIVGSTVDWRPIVKQALNL